MTDSINSPPLTWANRTSPSKSKIPHIRYIYDRTLYMCLLLVYLCVLTEFRGDLGRFLSFLSGSGSENGDFKRFLANNTQKNENSFCHVFFNEISRLPSHSKNFPYGPLLQVFKTLWEYILPYGSTKHTSDHVLCHWGAYREHSAKIKI